MGPCSCLRSGVILDDVADVPHRICHIVWLLASLLGRWQRSPVEVGVEGVREREGRDLRGWWWSLATVVVRWHCVGVVEVVLVRIGLMVVRDAQIERRQMLTFNLHDHATYD